MMSVVVGLTLLKLSQSLRFGQSFSTLITLSPNSILFGRSVEFSGAWVVSIWRVSAA